MESMMCDRKRCTRAEKKETGRDRKKERKKEKERKGGKSEIDVDNCNFNLIFKAKFYLSIAKCFKLLKLITKATNAKPNI